MNGGTLRSRLSRHGNQQRPEASPLNWRQRLAAVVGAVRGLAFLHNRLGYVHMDVRPANILLDSASSMAKLANFGMVCLVGSKGHGKVHGNPNIKTSSGDGDAADNANLSSGGDAAATPMLHDSRTSPATNVFCSPESQKGMPACAAMDVFSIGVTLLEAITGNPAETRDGATRTPSSDGSKGKKKAGKGKKPRRCSNSGGSSGGDGGTVLDLLAAPLRQLQGRGHPGRLEQYVDPAIVSEEAVRAEAIFTAAAACLHVSEGERPSTAELLDMLEMLLETASADESFAANKQQGSLVQLEETLGITSRKNWQSWKRKGMDQQKLFAISRDSTEYAAVAAEFLQTLPHKTIVRVERVENGPQHEAFHLAAATIRKQLGSQFNPATMQRMLFHGTTAIESIVNSTDGTAVGGMFGNGTYFARDAKYSNDYARNLPGGKGRKQMLMVEVVVGKWTRGKKGVKVMPLLPGQQYARFNSLADVLNDPSIFVVHHSNQAYPAYLITYE
eukprot:gene55-18181_t